jgi:hypothetical protein
VIPACSWGVESKGLQAIQAGCWARRGRGLHRAPAAMLMSFIVLVPSDAALRDRQAL